MKKILIAALSLILFKTTTAQLSTAEIFSSNMVLQREKPIIVWGKAKPNQKITATFNQQKVKAVADTAGNWKLTFKATKASTEPKTMQIKTADSTITYQNILVGDVWLCSGQSNMEYPMDRKLKKYAAPKKGTDVSAEELANPNKPEAVRVLYVERTLNKQPLLPTKGWATSNDTIVRYVSAIGYHFAKEINAEVGVPVGIISSSWGGTKIEEWTPDWAYEQSADFKDSTTTKNFKINNLHPGQKFGAMIKPIVPLAIKGVLWYQGENNCNTNDNAIYPKKFQLWVNTWRTLFNDKNLPFYYVQIAPCLYTARLKDNPRVKDSTTLALMWEAQAKCLSIPNIGMAVTTDLVDNLMDIHPTYKWTVAHRLALWAKAKTYGINNIEFSGPVYENMKVEANKIVLSFSHAEGLATNDNKPLTFFTIAGDDGIFYPAIAEIINNKVVVSAKEVAQPKHVRFAWQENAQPNFINAAGLPALPFRTAL